MKKNWRNKRVWFLVPLIGLFLACQNGESHRHAEGEVYTCPMHPQIVQNKPGTCPICHMDLVKRPSLADSTHANPASGHAHTADATEGLDHLLKPTHSYVVSDVQTIYPVKESREITVELPGSVEYDARRQQVVSARFGGRIEKLYVRYNYQPVRKGQKLFEIYSPELLTAQQEFLFLLEKDADNAALIASARQKLSLLGLAPAQINQIAATRQPQYRLAVYSPYDGFVVENSRPASSSVAPSSSASNASAAGMGGMSGAGGGKGGASYNTPPPPPITLTITEGAYLGTGTPVFRVVNADKVWAVFRSYVGDHTQLRTGAPIEITPEYDPNKKMSGRIDLIEPFFREGQNTATLRVYLNNTDGRLLSGQLLTGKIRLKSGTGLWLPRSAVLDVGNRRVVFVKKEKTLQPQAVKTGIVHRDSIQVVSGLTEGQAVAQNAQYLVDSESFLRAEAQ